MAAGAGSVWVGNQDGGVQRIDAATGEVVATLRVGHTVSAIAVTANTSWVAVTRAA